MTFGAMPFGAASCVKNLLVNFSADSCGIVPRNVGNKDGPLQLTSTFFSHEAIVR